MALKENTILITGGSSGIGLELASQLSEHNTILICGRTQEKLEKAKEKIPSLYYLQCDLSIAEECERLAKWVNDEHPDCNILINNAAIVHDSSFLNGEEILNEAENEIQTNLMAPIRLAKLLFPVLEKNNQPIVINVTTGLVYVPRAKYPFYNATKAALHSFTKVFREQAKNSQVKITEVLFPAVDTPWHKGNPPEIAISAKEAVKGMLKGLEHGKSEIKVGKVKLLYVLSRIAPNFAFKKLNKLAEK